MNRSFSLSLCLAFAGLISLPVLAQDLRRMEPQPVPDTFPPEQPASRANANPNPNPEAGAAATPAAPVSAGPLRGLVVLLDASQVSAQAPQTQGLDLTHVQALPKLDRLRETLQPLIGQPVTNELLTRIRLAIGGYFTKTGAPFSRVSIPVQDISHGVVQVVLIRGRVGKIHTEGGHYFSPQSYTQAIHLEPGDVVSETELEQAADWINLNPFRHAAISAMPGSGVGDVDLLVRAQDEFPLRVYGGFNDDGQSTTGENQLFAGFNWGNVTGIGDQLNFQHTMSPDAHRLLAESASYTLPLPWRNLLVLSGAWSRVNPTIESPLDQTGHSSQIGMRYEIPLPAAAGDAQMLAVGLDYKRTDNTLDFSQIPVFGSDSTIFQDVTEYTGRLTDRFGVNRWDTKLVLSPGGIGGDNTDAAFDAQRAGAHSRYAYLNADLQRDTRLPGNFTWSSELLGQWASGNLLGSEQLSFGGATNNRGYDPGAVYADEGINLHNELRLPPFSPLGMLGANVGDSLQALVFWDYGYGVVRFPVAGEASHYVLSSVGPGVRFALGKYLNASLDYGWQLTHVATDRIPGDGRIHFSVTASW